MRKKILSGIPNFITSLNLIAGSMAVIASIEGLLGLAALLVIIAAVFDFLDGLAARLLNAYSAIGSQLDSLADVISFGLAPACILINIMKIALFGNDAPIAGIEATPMQWMLLACPLLIPVAGAFRLAKFNIDTRQSDNFLGLPIPANALFHASLALIIAFGDNHSVSGTILYPPVIVIVTFVFSALMVSGIPMFSMKMRHMRWKGNQTRFVFAGLAVVLALILKFYALPLIIISYVILSLLWGRESTAPAD